MLPPVLTENCHSARAGIVPHENPGAASGSGSRSVTTWERSCRFCRGSDLLSEIYQGRNHEQRECPPRVTSVAGAYLAELHYAFAVARIGDQEPSLRPLEHAYSTGWRDADWPERDLELRALQSHPIFTALVQKIRSLPSSFDMSLARAS